MVNEFYIRYCKGKNLKWFLNHISNHGIGGKAGIRESDIWSEGDISVDLFKIHSHNIIERNEKQFLG